MEYQRIWLKVSLVAAVIILCSLGAQAQLSANPDKVIAKLNDLRFLSFGTGDIWREMAIRLAAEMQQKI